MNLWRMAPSALCSYFKDKSCSFLSHFDFITAWTRMLVPMVWSGASVARGFQFPNVLTLTRGRSQGQTEEMEIYKAGNWGEKWGERQHLKTEPQVDANHISVRPPIFFLACHPAPCWVFILKRVAFKCLGRLSKKNQAGRKHILLPVSPTTVKQFQSLHSES